MMAEPERKVFTIESCESKMTAGDEPRAFKRIRMKPGGWATVWVGKDRAFCDEHVGKLVSALIEEVPSKPGDDRPPLKNASDFEEATAAQTSEQMTNKDWDAKEDRDHLRRLYNSHLIQMTTWFLQTGETVTVVESEAEEPLERRPSYSEIVGFARKAAIADVTWIRAYHTSDVPFESTAQPRGEADDDREAD
jgi:hypothetical protein